MADIQVAVTLKDASLSRILSAINSGADKTCTILIRDIKDPMQNFSCAWDYTYLPKQGGETNQQYGSRFLASFVRAFVKAIEWREAVSARNATINAIPAATINVPDDIVEAVSVAVVDPK